MASGGGDTGDGSCSSEAEAKSATDLDVEGLTKTFAFCKWFNVAKGFGFVSLEEQTKEEKDEPDEKRDIFVYQSAIKMSGFRSLREGERLEVWYKKSDKGLEAVRVSGPDGADCLGSEKRPKRRKRAADRCYNCGESGHHAKECQLPPLPKRCHHCKSVDHLVADCPLKRDRSETAMSQQPLSPQGAQGVGYGSPPYASEQQRHLPHPTSSNNHSTSTAPPTSPGGQYGRGKQFS